ncbi:hypothetical protein LWI28_000482 [Acer negundo]|uniref:Ubiquitin-like protease family profile domain-containing protein n=1 Tax=Acer negundo TaxID=4023 RepID=A0AAD5J8U7_ACENE|nr:hypothetical protein LWI28_000482 [Acer negundo]
MPNESTSNRGSPRAGLPPCEKAEIARDRQLSKWLKSPYTYPFKAQKKVEVIVPYNVGSSHCVIRLHEWEITIYDSNAHLLPDNPQYRQKQVLPLRRLFPLICNKSGYYDMSKRKNRGLACMKAMRLAPYQFPCQVEGSNCGAFMLKGIKYVIMGKEPNFNFVQHEIPGFRKQFARDIFANSLEP